MTDVLVEHVAELAVCLLTVITRKDFLREPFFSLEILAHVFSIFFHSRPLAPDAELQGRPMDDFHAATALKPRTTAPTRCRTTTTRRAAWRSC